MFCTRTTLPVLLLTLRSASTTAAPTRTRDFSISLISSTPTSFSSSLLSTRSSSSEGHDSNLIFCLLSNLTAPNSCFFSSILSILSVCFPWQSFAIFFSVSLTISLSPSISSFCSVLRSILSTIFPFSSISINSSCSDTLLILSSLSSIPRRSLFDTLFSSSTESKGLSNLFVCSVQELLTTPMYFCLRGDERTISAPWWEARRYGMLITTFRSSSSSSSSSLSPHWLKTQWPWPICSSVSSVTMIVCPAVTSPFPLVGDGVVVTDTFFSFLTISASNSLTLAFKVAISSDWGIFSLPLLTLLPLWLSLSTLLLTTIWISPLKSSKSTFITDLRPSRTSSAGAWVLSRDTMISIWSRNVSNSSSRKQTESSKSDTIDSAEKSWIFCSSIFLFDSSSSSDKVRSSAEALAISCLYSSTSSHSMIISEVWPPSEAASSLSIWEYGSDDFTGQLLGKASM